MGKMLEAEIKTTGLHCPKCDKRVVDALMAVDGVAEARSDHREGLAWVTYDCDRTDIDALKTAIVEEGFGVA